MGSIFKNIKNKLKIRKREMGENSNFAKGLHLSIAVGSYAGFYANLKKDEWRICLGFIAFTIRFYDFEDEVKNVFKEFKQTIKQLNDFETQYQNIHKN